MTSGPGSPSGTTPMSRASVDGVTVDAQAVAKRFGGTQALDAVSVRVEPGTVHALVGENGAGKSTLGKIIAGAIRPDAGEILIDGERTVFGGPRDALRLGIALIEQEISLVPHRSVIENVLLGREPRTRGIVDRRACRAEFERVCAASGLDLDGNARAGSLRLAEQQKVEILRAIARDARLIVMDEPTSSLTSDEVDRLHGIVRELDRKSVV